MAGNNPTLKTSDVTIICINIVLMGAPTVLGNHISRLFGEVLFYGPLATLILFVTWRWGGWAARQLRNETDTTPVAIDNRGGAIIAGDNAGLQNVYNAPVTNYHVTPPTHATSPSAQSPAPISPKRVIPVRDTKLKDAIAYAVTGRWDSDPLEETHDGSISKAATELANLRQHAADGRLRVWGRNYTATVYELIPAHYWTQYEVEYLSLFRDEAAVDEDALPRPPYRGLMVSKAEIEELWPPKRDAAAEFIGLREAAREAFEGVEDTPFGKFLVNFGNGNQNEIIRYLIIAFANYGELYGTTPPSTNIRPLDRERVKHLWWIPNTDSLGDITGKTVIYERGCIAPNYLRALIEMMRSWTEDQIRRGGV